MKKIGITTESSADLTEELIKKYNLGVVSFKVDLSKFEGIKGGIFNKMRTAEERGIDSTIKTSQPSLKDYLEMFKKKLEGFEEIVHVAISSKVTGAYNSAIQAKKFLGKDGGRVHVLDSEKGSGAQGLLVLKALEDVEKGLELGKIEKNIKERAKKSFLIFMYDNPKWVMASGRCPKIAQIGLQKLKDLKMGVVMREKDGVLKLMSIKRNTIDLAEPLFEEFRKMTKDVKTRISVVIAHGDNQKEADKLKEKLESLKNVKVLYSTLLDVVLGAHAGPDALLLNFIYE
ncbi:MAG: DegV family protein [Candidatus Pacebacteria bacterium]|nr:DegV family protein [Candidatus Paceibacterota bacterium]